jgi:hypothetical protein
MHVEQYIHSDAGWNRPLPSLPPGSGRGFVLAFGAREVIEAGAALADVARARGDLPLLVASTSGEIAGMDVSDGKLVVTVVRFDTVRVVARRVPIGPNDSSHAVGKALAASLPASVEGAGLRHVMVLSDGLAVNGTALVDGMSAALPDGCAITGGLAGDAGRFERTLVGLDGNVGSGQVVALGLYGGALVVGYGSLGGWDAFGPERRADNSDGNVLRTLDGEVALDVYKRYLGEHAAGLPGSALRFPLAVTAPGAGRAVVRTILAVDEATGAMTFAGDIPVGSRVRLMKANHERLVEGAEEAGRLAMRPGARLALLISCVGRKLVMGQRTEEEVEAVAAALGAGGVVAGFYSYGELCPVDAMSACELHNQTMTVTTFGEAA